MATTPLSRREFFGTWRQAEERPPKPMADALAPYLRPPGAMEESALLATCKRCGACREACPHESIRPLGPAYGDAMGTPAILPDSRPCYLCEDLACMSACPSGALQPVERTAIRMGMAHLDAARCWAVLGQPCDYCVGICPVGPNALRLTDPGPVVAADGCVGCGACQYICTAVPPAIRVDATHTTEKLG